MTLQELKPTIAAVVSLGALAFFAVLQGSAAVLALTSRVPGELLEPPVVNTATTLAGLVSAVVAAAFGIQRPPAPEPLPASRVHRGLIGISRVTGMDRIGARRDERDWRDLVSASYLIVYFLVGATALLAYLLVPTAALAEYTRTTAMLTIGVVVAIVNSFLAD